MKKSAVAISVLLIVLIGGYIFYQKFLTPSPVDQNPIINNQQTSGSTTNQQSQSSTGSGSQMIGNGSGTGSMMQGMYKDGSYTGQVADAFYGNVQVRATISGGKITDIQFLQYPNNAGHSIEVSSYSLPILRSEAIQKQSANVDIVSGATQTSGAFAQSLSSALSHAQS